MKSMVMMTMVMIMKMSDDNEDEDSDDDADLYPNVLFLYFFLRKCLSICLSKRVL